MINTFSRHPLKSQKWEVSQTSAGTETHPNYIHQTKLRGQTKSHSCCDPIFTIYIIIHLLA